MARRFHKMHGLGNDFVVFDAREERLAMDPRRARAIADRKTGVGCDQLIVLERSILADVKMRIFNSDGGEVEACGNAARCITLLTGGGSIETEGGIVSGSADGAEATVDMGEPRFGWEEIPLAYAMDIEAMPVAWEELQNPFAVNVGNPHAVFFVPDADAVDLARLGPQIEKDPLFPTRINVNVASPEDGAIRLRVWERGAGLTLACGTGACATAVAAISRGLAASPVEVRLPVGKPVDPLVAGLLNPDERPRHPCLHRRDRIVSGLELITMGCRLNLAESEAMRILARGQDDLIIVNSCAVTNEAVRQTRQAIRRAKRARPDARVIVTGCAAQIEPQTFAAMPEVERVVGNKEKFERESFTRSVWAEPVEALPLPLPEEQGTTALRQAQGKRMLGFGISEPDNRVSDIMDVRESAPHLAAGRQ